MAASASVSGLVSGLDTEGIIAKIKEFGARPITILQNKQATITNRLTSWQDANTRLLALKMKSDSISSPAAFQTKSVSVSDEKYLSASVTSDASPGSFTITVNNLAKSQQIQSQSYSDTNSPVLGTGTVTVGVGESAKSITIDSTNNSLSGLKDAINRAGVGATASIIDLGSQDAHDYRLVLKSNTTGAANTVAWTPSLAGGTAPTWTTTEAASDASITVGTGPTATTLTKSSNTISGLAPGLTLNLKEADATKPIQVNVKSDTDAVKQKIKDFVTQYNSVMDFMNGHFTYDPETKESGVLFGDYTLQNVQRDLRSNILSPIEGLPSSMNALSQIGFSSDTKDRLVLDESKLSQMIESDPNGVMKLFAGHGQSAGNSISYLDSTQATQATAGGPGYKVRVDQPALQARVTAGAAQTANLTANERLTINGVGIDLTAGMTPQQVVDKINSFSADSGVIALRTQADGTGTGDHLTLKRVSYGSKGTIVANSTVSNGGGTPAADTSGIGKTQVTESLGIGETGTGTAAKGKDVAGAFGVTRGGVTTWEAATGSGQMLSGNTGNKNTDGLKVMARSETAGEHGQVTLTQGIGEAMDRMLAYLTGKQGAVTGAQDTLTKQIGDLKDEITSKQDFLTRYEDKLRKKYSDLESAMGRMQSQGSYLSSQFSAMNKSR